MSNKQNSLKKLSGSSNLNRRSSSPKRNVDGIVRKEKRVIHSSQSIRSLTTDSLSLKRKLKELEDYKQAKEKEESLLKSQQELESHQEEDFDEEVDDKKRMFLKMAGVAGLGMVASAVLPKKADAYIAGGAPTSNVVGVKDDANNRINPATEETVSALLTGQGVTKLTTSLASSGNVRVPASGKKIRVYATRFSLTADATSVSFRFTSSGTDYEKYLSPKTGGLYGSNNHPNFVEGGVDEALYCIISGTTTVQINVDYLEV